MSDATNPPVAEKPPAAEGKKKPVPALEIRAATHRRRAGFAFGPEPVVIPIARLKEPQVAALEADPMLTIREVDANA